MRGSVRASGLGRDTPAAAGRATGAAGRRGDDRNGPGSLHYGPGAPRKQPGRGAARQGAARCGAARSRGPDGRARRSFHPGRSAMGDYDNHQKAYKLSRRAKAQSRKGTNLRVSVLCLITRCRMCPCHISCIQPSAQSIATLMHAVSRRNFHGASNRCQVSLPTASVSAASSAKSPPTRIRASACPQSCPHRLGTLARPRSLTVTASRPSRFTHGPVAAAAGPQCPGPWTLKAVTRMTRST